MKTLTLILTTAIVLTSCLHTQNFSRSQSTSNSAELHASHVTTKLNLDRKYVKSKNGLILMYPKTN